MNTAHNSSVKHHLASCAQDSYVEFSLLIVFLQMWILILGVADISQGHAASKLLRQSLVFLTIPSIKHTGIIVIKMAAASPLHQTGDGERYMKQNCPVWSSKSKLITLLLHLSKEQTWVFRTLGSVMLTPETTCQLEHRPIKEHLQVCRKCDSYICIFQEMLQLKPYLY